MKVMNSHRKVAFSRLFNHRKFENIELEHLYQRYIFKLQQSSIVSALLLLALLSFTIAILQFYYAQTATVIGMYCLLQCIIFLSLFVVSFRMNDTQLLALCYVILLFCVLFCVLLSPLNTHYGNIGVNWNSIHYRPSEGVWPIVFVIFLTYTMLPIKITISLLFGLLLSAAHIAVTMTKVTSFNDTVQDVHQHFIRKQVCHY